MKTSTKILHWLLGLFIFYLIIEILRKMFGGSLGFEELVIGLLIANIGYVITLHAKVGEIKSTLAEHLGWHRGQIVE